MNTVVDLGISTGVGLLVGAVAYLLMVCFGILEPQRFPHRGAHIERPRAAEIDLVGRRHGGSVAADLHHHERQWGAEIEAGAAASPAAVGGVMCLATVEAGTAQKADDRGSNGCGDGFVSAHVVSLNAESEGGQRQ